jgi:cell division GTPase FtsZ
MSTNTFTRWGIVASGEGGGRIASQFVEGSENPGIDGRILTMNTNRADLRNTIDRMSENLPSNDDSSDLMQQYGLEFGSQQGAGNFWPNGEACAEEALERITNEIGDRFDNADAFMHIATVGGGTGNGSIPYTIKQFKNGFNDLTGESGKDWMDSIIHTTFAVWPYYYEQPQRHFNAICGLSRLLRNEDGSQNADMVLLASNSHLSEDASGGNGQYDSVNSAVIQAVDMMIGAGRETRSVIDIKDYVTLPSQMDAYHFTPAIATDMNADVYELDFMADKAAENTFVPLEIGTSSVVYMIVRAPESMINEGEISEPEVYKSYQDWTDKHDINAAGQATLTPKPGRGDDVDVMLLLGGFDLNPLLDHSWDDFDLLSGQLTDDEKLPQARLDKIRNNIEDYVDKNSE